MRYCLVIDLNRCTGCEACIVSCKLENNIDLGTYWNRVLPVGPFGDFPDLQQYWLPMQCQQCENAECVRVCPTGASYRDEQTNVVLIDKEKCIGCQYCVYACPYGVRSYNKKQSVVEKCTLCSHLTMSGEGVPACVHNCCGGARFFGDLDDPESDVSKVVKAAEEKDPASIHRLGDPGGAHPSTIYILSESIATWKELM